MYEPAVRILGGAMYNNNTRRFSPLIIGQIAAIRYRLVNAGVTFRIIQST